MLEDQSPEVDTYRPAIGIHARIFDRRPVHAQRTLLIAEAHGERIDEGDIARVGGPSVLHGDLVLHEIADRDGLGERLLRKEELCCDGIEGQIKGQCRARGRREGFAPAARRDDEGGAGERRQRIVARR